VAIPGGCGLGFGVACPSRSGGGSPVPLRLQCVWKFCAVPLWKVRQSFVGFSRSIAGCLSIAVFTLLSPGNSTPRLFSSRNWARGFLIRICDSSIAALEKPSSGHIEGKAHVRLF